MEEACCSGRGGMSAEEARRTAARRSGLRGRPARQHGKPSRHAHHAHHVPLKAKAKPPRGKQRSMGVLKTQHLALQLIKSVDQV